MDGELIGLFALLLGLELILGVDNVLVIAILVSGLLKRETKSHFQFWTHSRTDGSNSNGDWRFAIAAIDRTSLFFLYLLVSVFPARLGPVNRWTFSDMESGQRDPRPG